MRKGMKLLAALGLVTALATPAMADVNLNGFIRIKPFVSNLDSAFSGKWAKPIANSGTLTYVDERARLKFTAGDENAKAVAFFEFDQMWGDSAYTNGRDSGGGLEADTNNLETKNLYLWFKVPDTSLEVTAGVQNQTDAYSGIWFGAADFAGVFASAKFEPVALRLGWAKFWENSQKKADDVDLYVAEAKIAASKVANVGVSLYFLNDQSKGTLGSTAAAANAGIVCVDDATGTLINPPASGICPAGQTARTLSISGLGGRGATTYTKPSEYATGYRNLKLYAPGVNAAFDLGVAKLSGFFVYEMGTVSQARSATLATAHDVDINGYAADLRADATIGPGKAFVEGIYVSGDKNTADDKYKGFVNASSYNLAAAFFTRTDMYILMPNSDDTTTSNGLAYDVSNGGAGVLHVAAGASMDVIPSKLNAKVGLGYLQAAQKRASRDISSGGLSYNFANEKAMGTELNLAFNYNVSKGMDIGLVGAYAWLGDAFKVPGEAEPDDLYDVHARLNYAF